MPLSPEGSPRFSGASEASSPIVTFCAAAGVENRRYAPSAITATKISVIAAANEFHFLSRGEYVSKAAMLEGNRKSKKTIPQTPAIEATWIMGRKLIWV